MTAPLARSPRRGRGAPPTRPAPADLESAADDPAAAPYGVDVAPSYAAVGDLWERMAAAGAALPFQRRAWLDAWAATLGREPGVELVAATVRDARGAPVMALPLVRRHGRLLRTIAFADGGLTDYNAPILAPGAPGDRAGADAVWRALRRALPAADLVRLEKMPARVGERANPLALLAAPTPLSGLRLAMPDPYARWRDALPRHQRMELGRCGRLFDALPGAAFGRVEADGDGAATFAALEGLQRERIAALGLPYALDAAAPRAFYRALFRRHAGRHGVLTALTTADGVVAALFGLRYGATYVMLRLGIAGGRHARLSPGRLVITRTMEMLRADGVVVFDFALGDYPYKRRLGGEPSVLHDLVAGTSPAGVAAAAALRARAALRSDGRAGALARVVRAALR